MTIEDVIFAPGGEIIGREIVSASFEEWVSHVFDRPPQKKHWRWNEDFITWGAPAFNTVEFLTRTFDESATLLKQFTNAQVAEGLSYIACEALSDIALTLWDESVPWELRKRAIRSIRKLYSDCFEIRCDSHLSHLDRKNTEEPENPLNGACFMWWDGLPNSRPKNPSGKQIDDECLAVMEFALSLESDVCRESALHGLGHWVLANPEHVSRVINNFIASNPKAKPGLIAYAQRAREGKVL